MVKIFTKFQKRNVARKKRLVKLVEKKVYTPFPPAQQPRKIDLQIESGEYFLGKRKRIEKITRKRSKQEEVSETKRQEKS